MTHPASVHKPLPLDKLAPVSPESTRAYRNAFVKYLPKLKNYMANCNDWLYTELLYGRFIRLLSVTVR